MNDRDKSQCFYNRDNLLYVHTSQAVKKASEKEVRMIEPNLGVFITETTYCMFNGGEKKNNKKAVQMIEPILVFL
jgi:hypothetical protein